MTGFFYAGLTFLLLTFMWFMLPETKGRTFAELDVLFDNKVSARKFAKTNVDQLSGHSTIRMDSSDGICSDGEKPIALKREEV